MSSVRGYVTLPLLSAALLFSVGSAEAQSGGWYIGGSAGKGGYKTGYQRTAETIFTTGATAVNISRDEVSPTVWKGYVGYRLSPYVSMEGGYMDMGKVSYNATITAPVTATLNRNFKASGWGADVLLWLPFSNSVSAFAKMGSLYTTVKASDANPGAGLGSLPSETSRKLRPKFGIGLQFDFRNNLAARIEYERVPDVGDPQRFGTADLEMLTVGVNYRY